MFNLTFDPDVTNDSGDKYPFILSWNSIYLFGMTDREHAAGALEWCYYYLTDELEWDDESDRAKMRATVIQLFEGNYTEVLDAARTIAEKAVNDRWQSGHQRVCSIPASARRIIRHPDVDAAFATQPDNHLV